MILLPNCVSNHKINLGFNYEKLGKTKGVFLFRHKFLLSYSEKKGWSVVKLNILQLFLRCVIGAYKSTHLDHIALTLKKPFEFPYTEDGKKIHQKIKDFWQKKNVTGLGNSQLDQAKVICFAEDHKDKCFRDAIAQIINEKYQKDDIVLVESADAGVECDLKDILKDVKEGCIAWGWDCKENLKSGQIIKKKFENQENKLNEFLHFACVEEIKTLGEKKENLTKEEIVKLKIHIDELVKKVSDLNNVYQSQDDCIVNLEYYLNLAYNQLIEGELKNKIVFYAAVQVVYATFQSSAYNIIYKPDNFSFQEVESIYSDVKQRNASLIAEIEKYRKVGPENRKIFVIVGQSHVLKQSSLPSCEDVKACLFKDKFVTITRRSRLTRALNLDLKSIEIF